MMRCLKLSSLIILLFAACVSPYKDLQLHPGGTTSALQYKPEYQRELYRCVVDGRFVFKKFHLSGLLLFKELETGTRVVFQNEMGLTFFDFEWDKNDSFKINQVMPQLNKPAVLKTLQKDLSLLLMKGLDKNSERRYIQGEEVYHRFTLKNGYAYYIEKSARLMRVENVGDHKKVITITLEGKEKPKIMPEKVVFKHHKANFTIQLNKIEAHADE